MIKNEGFCLKSEFYETIFEGISSEIHTHLKKNYGEECEELVNSIVLILSEIVQLATTKETPKSIGSTAKDGSGNMSLIKMLPIPELKKKHINANDINKNDESYFYSLYKWGQQQKLKLQYEIKSDNLRELFKEYNTDELREIFKNQTKQSFKALLNNWTSEEKEILNSILIPYNLDKYIDKLEDDSLFSDINKLNSSLDEIKVAIAKYNTNLSNVKRSLVAIKHDKAHIYFIAQLYLYFLSRKICTDLIEKSFKTVQNKSSLRKIHEKKRKLILNDSKKFIATECNFEQKCKDSCDCPFKDGFKRCLHPPVCKNCGYEQEVVERSGDSFDGYEFYNDSDFCYSILGFKKSDVKKNIRKKKKSKKKKLEKKKNTLPKQVRKYNKIKR